MNIINHTFQFETTDAWKPMTPLCWVECPFNFNIGWGKSCKCLNEDDETVCPFVDKGIIDDFVSDQDKFQDYIDVVDVGKGDENPDWSNNETL